MPSPPDWVQAMRERCAAATPGPWTYGRHQSMSKDEMIAYLINCVEVSPLTDQFYIVGAPDWGADVCHTGNGPTSERNATFIAHARTDVPALLALVVTLAEALDEAHESLGIIQAAPTTSPLTTILTMRSIAKRGTKHVDEALARYHHGPGATTGGGDG